MPRRPAPWFRKSDGWWYSKISGKQVRLAQGKKNRPEAEKALNLRLAERDGGIAPVSSGASISVIQVLDEFLIWLTGNRSKATAAWHANWLNAFAQSIPANLSAADIAPRHVTEWLAKQSEWGGSSKHGAVRSIKQAFRWACNEKRIASYPLSGLKIAKGDSRDTVLTDEQIAAILANGGHRTFRDVLTVLLHTGCRPQEVRAIERRHFDAANHRVVFPRSESKGKKMARVIYLPGEAMEVITRLSELRSTGPIFLNYRKRPWTKDAIVCRFRALSKQVGFHVCAYTIRHTWATNSMLRGVDAITTSILMGHSDPATLARTYQHLSGNAQHMKKAADTASGSE